MNKALLMGRLTKDPEMTMTASEVSVAKFTLAVDRKYVPKDGEKKTDFINIVCFRQLADFVGKYFSKGQQAIVIGSIQTRTWEQDGQKRYATEIIADEVDFCGSKKDNADTEESSATLTTDEEIKQTLGEITDKTEEGFQRISDDDDLPF